MSEQQTVHEEYPDYKKPPYDREVNGPVIIKAMGVLVLITIAAFVGMWWMYAAMRDAGAAQDPAPGPFADELRTLEPPAPRLQFFPPTADIERLRSEEQERLGSYAEQAGTDGTSRYDLPIERAMEILSERGLPGQGNVDTLSEELFGDTAAAATSAAVSEPEPPAPNHDGGHE
jgi:hypothetical protein